MDQSSLDQALSRVGSAVARLERAVDEAIVEPGPAGDPALAARHEALRRKVGAALGELDTLIGSLER